MVVIGMTGGTGAGKGEISLLFERFDIPCLDTDRVSRLVCGPDMPCTCVLAEEFGREILTPDGCLKRKELAQIVFGEPDDELRAKKIERLNTITHAFILDSCRVWLDTKEKEGCRAAVIDAPQLFESGFDTECAKILGVTADKETRIARIMARDKITREKAEDRIAAQHTDDFFYEHCDAVIENNGELSALYPRLAEILRQWQLL